MTYAKSVRQSHFTIFAKSRYDENTSTKISNRPKATAQTPDGIRVTSSADDDMPAMSAAMLSVLAATTSTTSVRSIHIGITRRIAAMSPVPVTMPMRAHASWTAIIIGTVINATQSSP